MRSQCASSGRTDAAKIAFVSKKPHKLWTYPTRSKSEIVSLIQLYPKQNVLKELQQGEIRIAVPSVSKGYWNRNNEDLFIDLADFQWEEFLSIRYRKSGSTI